MNAKAIIPLIIGLGIAGLAAKLGLDFVRNAEGRQAKLVKLWTPVEDIKRGVAIAEPMLRPLPFPAQVAPQGALADLKKIVGRVPHTGAPAGLPILDSMLLPKGVNAGVRVPPGMRAVAVKINESSGVDNHLEPGCHVDVVGVFSIRTNGRAETVARTILEDVEVAAVGQRLAPSTPTPATETKGSSSTRRERPPQAVTLLVKPAQVPTLHLAEQKGKLKLSMRGVLDESLTRKTASVAEDDLLGLSEPKPAVPQPSLNDRLSGFVNSLWQKDQPAPRPEPEAERPPEPAAEAQPELAWVMVVYNGAERQVLGWADLASFQPIQLSTEGPNIFQDEPRHPPPEPGRGSQSGGKSRANPPADPESKPEPESKSERDTASETEFEPQELFE